jgi:hypothetical protein
MDAAANMVNGAHAAAENCHITGMLPMDINAAFPSRTNEKLVNLIKVMQMDGDVIQWTQRVLLE